MDKLTLSPDDLLALIEAIDSHIYWQLSDELYRHDGAVLDPGSDDEDTAAAIAAYRELQDRLEVEK